MFFQPKHNKYSIKVSKYVTVTPNKRRMANNKLNVAKAAKKDEFYA